MEFFSRQEKMRRGKIQTTPISRATRRDLSTFAYETARFPEREAS